MTNIISGSSPNGERPHLLQSCNLQLGGGLVAPTGWVCFDSSPALRLQRLPLLGWLFRGGSLPRFPDKAKWGHLSRGLPAASGTVDRIYCSNVLEHLSRVNFRKALAEAHRLLKPGGVFRLVVPDRARQARLQEPSPWADLSERPLVPSMCRVQGRAGRSEWWLRLQPGGSQHLWMWEYEGMENELRLAGFQSIRRAEIGDSGDPVFALVEVVEHWKDALGVECKKG